MRLTIALLLALAVATPAFAGGGDDKHHYHNKGGNMQRQDQQQDQSQGQGQYQAASANNTGNTTSLNQQYKEVRQTPFSYAPEALPTSPCIKGYSAGAASPLLAGTFGSGRVDKGCDARETAREFALMGNKLAAAKILCSTDAAKRAKLTLDDCLASTVPEPAPLVAAAPPPIVIPPASVTIQPQITVLPAPVVLPPPAPAKARATVKPPVSKSEQKCASVPAPPSVNSGK